MTENEAKFLEKLDELANDLEVDMYSVANLNFFFEESANTIRKLIEEIQQYRAIGTVEEIKEALSVADIQVDKLNAYKQLGTLEKVREAVERKLTDDEIDCFNAYISYNDMPIAFGNTDWVHVYSKIVGDKISDYAKLNMDE